MFLLALPESARYIFIDILMNIYLCNSKGMWRDFIRRLRQDNMNVLWVNFVLRPQNWN